MTSDAPCGRSQRRRGSKGTREGSFGGSWGNVMTLKFCEWTSITQIKYIIDIVPCNTIAISCPLTVRGILYFSCAQ